MKIYTDFFYNFSKEVSKEFNEPFGEIKEMPDRSFKFTCHLGYKFEIIIHDIQLLDYPIMIGNTYLNYIDRNMPCFLKGVRYYLSLLHNGSGVGKENRFSSVSKLYSDLNNNFEALFGELYFDDNFARNIGKEIQNIKDN